MTFGPYQSNLLRFAIAQYRQGLNRHRVALRTARSGAVTGVAVILLPAYAVGSASQLAGQWVRQRLERSLTQKTLPGVKASVKAKIARLLDFSDFRETSLSLLKTGDLKRQDDLSEQILAQTLLTVGEGLSPQQVSLLAASDRQRTGLLKQAQGLFGRLWLGKPHEIAVSDRITGVASDVETRSLVLVKGHTLVWHGLSAEQQIKLQKKIAVLLSSEYADDSLALPSQADLVLFEKGRFLTRSVHSFWVEVLRMMVWLRRDRCNSKAAPQLSSSSAQLSSGGKAGLKIARLRRSKPHAAILLANASFPKVSSADSFDLEGCASVKTPPLTKNTPDFSSCLEATVITVEYVEHPLETLLKWVDRLLIRLENVWQMFKQWLLSLRSAQQDRKRGEK